MVAKWEFEPFFQNISNSETSKFNKRLQYFSSKLIKKQKGYNYHI